MRTVSQKQEDRIAENIGGKRVSNSGATKFDKGDVINLDWLIEAKTRASTRKNLCIQREWLDKLRDEAYAHRRYYYALAISFDNEKDYFVIEDSLFYKMLKVLEEQENV